MISLIFTFVLIENGLLLKLFWVPYKQKGQFNPRTQHFQNKYIFLNDNDSCKKVALLSNNFLHIQTSYEFKNSNFSFTDSITIKNYQLDLCSQLLYLHETYKSRFLHSNLKALAIRDLTFADEEELDALKNTSFSHRDLISFYIYSSEQNQEFLKNFDKNCPDIELRGRFDTVTKVHHTYRYNSVPTEQAFLQCEAACLSETGFLLYLHFFGATLLSFLPPLLLLAKFILFKLQRSLRDWLNLITAFLFLFRNLMLVLTLQNRHNGSQREIYFANLFDFADYFCFLLFFLTEKYLIMNFYNKKFHHKLFRVCLYLGGAQSIKVLIEIVLKNSPNKRDVLVTYFSVFINTAIGFNLFFLSFVRAYAGKIVPGMEKRRKTLSFLICTSCFFLFSFTNLLVILQSENHFYKYELLGASVNTLLLFFKLFVDIMNRELRSRIN